MSCSLGLEMNDRRQDFELLQRFMRNGEQSAFADLVRRHLDLVFATALRKVEDPGAAQEVAQNVFAAVARKAWRFASDDSLPAWLHKAALFESKSWLRGELARRRRERTAAELGTTMKTPEDQPAFNALLPLLDEALLSLREKDRTALLLRFYESQSLREVGAAFGVSEDTAQKRVQSALEKLADFFKRRGFRTATAAAAAAALQHTASSASATMVSAVVGAALKATPPALAGFGALLAKVTSMSRSQTAAVCLALAAVPVGWQLTERHMAGEEAKRVRIQLLAAQNERATLQAEMDRLRATSGRLEQLVSEANEAAARAAESARAFEVWKKRIRGLLTASDYRWDDDSPFAQIPKAVLPQLSELSGAEPFSAPGFVRPYARELLGMTPAERESVEDTLHRYLAEMEGRLAAGMYETNNPDIVSHWPGGQALGGKVFGIHAMAEEDVKPRAERLLAEVRGMIGEERWPVVQVRLNGQQGGRINSGNLSSFLDLDAGTMAQEIRLVVGTDAEGRSLWFGLISARGVAGYANGALSAFLPEGDPNRTGGADSFGGGLSKGLRQRAATWLQEQATARFGKEARR